MDPDVLFENFLRQCRDQGWFVRRIGTIRNKPLPNYKLRLVIGDVEATLNAVEIGEYPLPPNLALSVARASNANFVLAPKIGPMLSSQLRDMQINHADLAGRLSIRSPGLVVEMDPRSNLKSDDLLKTWINEHDRTTTVDLTSPKTAQLVFCLLAWPRLMKAPTRLLAEVAGVSLGLVPRAIRYLEETGMVHERQWVDSGRALTAQTWLAAYRSKLRPTLSLDQMESPFGLDLNLADATVSGGSAVPELIHPRTATIYIPSLTSDFIRVNRLRRSSTPNIELRKKFWSLPPDSFLGEPRSVDESHLLTNETTAPPLLVYADLISSIDSREQEIASVFVREEPRLQWLRPITL
jgi:hypothetical protein